MMASMPQLRCLVVNSRRCKQGLDGNSISWIDESPIWQRVSRIDWQDTLLIRMIERTVAGADGTVERPEDAAGVDVGRPATGRLIRGMEGPSVMLLSKGAFQHEMKTAPFAILLLCSDTPPDHEPPVEVVILTILMKVKFRARTQKGQKLLAKHHCTSRSPSCTFPCVFITTAIDEHLRLKKFPYFSHPKSLPTKTLFPFKISRFRNAITVDPSVEERVYFIPNLTIAATMGCGGSKAEDLPLVVRCRERRDLIRAAANHRYSLAAAHISYFRSLRDVGDALRRFVDEELVTAASSSNSSFSSPSLTLPRDSKQKHGNADESSRHLRDFDDEDEDDDESHLHISESSSDADFDDDFLHHHHHPPNNHYPPQHKHQQQQHESEQDAHLHHNHKHQAHKGKKKGSDGEPSHFHSEEESSPHYPRAGFHGYGNDQDREPEASFHYPGEGNFRRYGSGFGDVYGNDPFSDLPHSHPFNYPQQPASTSYGAPYMDQWDQPAAPPPWYYSNNTNVFYMRKGAPAAQTVVHEPPPEPAQGYSDLYWNPAYGNLGYGANYGYAAIGMRNNEAGRDSRQKEVPPPPSPKASGWDFFNPFDGFENGYEDIYSGKRYGYRSSSSSPDSAEVREREGIPDLEEETESEVYNKEVLKGNNKMKDKGKGKNVENSSKSMPHQGGESSLGKESFRKSEGRPKPVPVHNSKSSSRSVPSSSSLESESEKNSVPLQHKKGSAKLSMPSELSDKSGKKPSVPLPQYKTGSEKTSIPPQYSEKSVKGKPSISLPEDEGSSRIEMEGSISSLSDENSSSSPENVVLERVNEGYVRRKGVIFEVEEVSKQDGESSKLSSVTMMSPRGNRDLREVVAEIRDEFEMASAYGKEVAVMLEVGKVPYRPSFLKVIRSRILYPLSPSLSSCDPPSLESARLASRTMKLAKSYFDDVGKNVDTKACNLSSTLDKLYAWEKKLYKEVKDEEKLRVVYEKQCKRLKILDEEGAEPVKIDSTRASIRRLLTKLDVSVKAIDAISIRIHKLRDEELQPQVAELIHGFIRMWKSMLKCHQKQFQAVMDSKMRRLRVNTASRSGPDPASRASARLERELQAWCSRFNDWINSQKSYVESLNGWLLHCLQYEPEETPDGPVPYSPGRLGAPPIFVICNDWAQAMRAVSEARVADAMNTFAASLRQLWEKQDEEDRQRVKAEYFSRDYKKRVEEEKKGLPMVVQSDSNSGGGVSRLDDLKVDLDSMKEKVAEERVKHKDAMKLVNDAASRSLQGGLVPIFKALESFTKEALNAHEHVRFERPGPGS
ncbi:Protein of unknown function (DUF630 and DUF632 [Striga hermonthica]|uniref:Uncharacterized protein n=1 Tax=Striga hermonthica TaxID=68872 RepID=A0A9N7NBL5_STRHE|nr:Protein of unknown function (DUF630 and DUF632 [Striga hermonthica]